MCAHRHGPTHMQAEPKRKAHGYTCVRTYTGPPTPSPFWLKQNLPPHFLTHLTPPGTATAVGHGVGEAVLQAPARPHSSRVALQEHQQVQTTTN